jgi:tRNA A37 threonylcarbamoyladenosine synthetase subunit TsaC/SUA5/YrdC
VKEFGKPITSTSANLTGQPTLSSVQEILAQFGEKASMITRVIDGGILPQSKPSTVVDVRGDTPIFLRIGAISEVAIL